MSDYEGPVCCVGECCGAGSYCCARAGEHNHENEDLRDALYGVCEAEEPPCFGCWQANSVAQEWLAQHDAELRKEIAWEIRAMGSESWDGYTPDEVPGTVAARLAEGGSLEGGESR